LVAEDRIGLAGSAEARFSIIIARVLIGMIGTRYFTVRLFDAARIGVTLHTQNLIIILTHLTSV
jgi:hypothetical protein